MQTTVFRRALLRYDRTGKTSAEEMARVVGVSAQHIRAIEREDRHLSAAKMAKLSSWLVDELGLTDHLQGFLGASGAIHFHPDQVENDDCLRDEIFTARQHMAEADALLKEEKRAEAAQEMKTAIQQVKAGLADVEQPAQ